jgi:hypothetical protein
MAPGAAREHVRVARTLTDMPLIHAAFRSGELSYSKVRELTRVAGRVDEEYLLDLARTATASQLERAVRGFRRSDPDRLKQEVCRSVRWHTDDDGSVRLSVVLPAEDGAALIAALELAMQHLHEEHRRASRDDPDIDPDAGRRARTRVLPGCDPAQVQDEPRVQVSAVDGLLRVATQYLAHAPVDTSGADRTTVVVHVDLATLAAATSSARDCSFVPTDPTSGASQAPDTQAAATPTAAATTPSDADDADPADASTDVDTHSASGTLVSAPRSCPPACPPHAPARFPRPAPARPAAWASPPPPPPGWPAMPGSSG